MAGRRPPPAPPAFLGRSIRQFTHEQLVEFVGLVSRWLLQLSRYVYDAYTGLSAAHAPTHLPSGSDPLTTGTPVSIGMTNSAGDDESISLSDHVHATPLTTKGDLMTVASSALARVGVGTDTHVLTADSAQTAGIKWAAASAAMSQSFVTTASEASLSGERVLTGTANQVVVTDNGANSTVVLSTPQNIHTAATPTFTGALLGDGSATAPSVSWTSDNDGTGTGLYRNAANSVGITTNGVLRWDVDATGNLITGTDNAVDIGASGATRPRNIYVGTNIVMANTQEIRFRDSAGTERQVLVYDSANNVGLINNVNANVTISCAVTGTGKIRFITQGAGRWRVTESGHMDAEADNSFDIGNPATSARPRTIRAATSMVLGTASNGAEWTRGYNTELVTIAAAATSDSGASLLPANAIIEAVLIRVTVAPPGTATFNLGDATTATRFATGVSTTINTTNVSIDQWLGSVTTAAAGPTQAAAAKIRITPNAVPSDATGRCRVTVFYRSFTPPTS